MPYFTQNEASETLDETPTLLEWVIPEKHNQSSFTYFYRGNHLYRDKVFYLIFDTVV